ncbi:hypothetical protein EV2_038886 [Malus domestica]
MATISLGLFLVLVFAIAICHTVASVFQPISDSHRSTASELFALADGSYGSETSPTPLELLSDCKVSK